MKRGVTSRLAECLQQHKDTDELEADVTLTYEKIQRLLITISHEAIIKAFMATKKIGLHYSSAKQPEDCRKAKSIRASQAIDIPDRKQRRGQLEDLFKWSCVFQNDLGQTHQWQQRKSYLHFLLVSSYSISHQQRGSCKSEELWMQSALTVVSFDASPGRIKFSITALFQSIHPLYHNMSGMLTMPDTHHNCLNSPSSKTPNQLCKDQNHLN